MSDALDALAAAAAVAHALAPPPHPRHSRLTEKQRWSIVIDHERGDTHDQIAARLGVNRSTVRRVLRRERTTSKVGSGGRSGRPRCMWRSLLVLAKSSGNWSMIAVGALPTGECRNHRVTVTADMHFFLPEQWYLLHDNDKK
jgi:hypothetical protein